MFGQRRALGTRTDSHKNINAGQADKIQNLKNSLVADNQQPKDLKSSIAKSLVLLDEKPKPVAKPPVKHRKGYGGRQCLISEDFTHDIDHYLRSVERSRQVEDDFLKDAKIDGRMRGILLDWLSQIQAKFGLIAETFYLSTFILDRVIIPLDITRQNFQLVGLACMLIASKFEEILIPNVNDFVYMGGDFCSLEDLFKAERDVLRALKFRLSFAYPSHFMRKLRLLVPPGNDHAKVYEIAKILVDISMMDYNLVAWLPSEMAAASFYLAYKIAKVVCPVELLETVGVTTMEAIEKSKILGARIHTHADPDGKLKGLRLKFKDTEALEAIDKHIEALKNLNSQ